MRKALTSVATISMTNSDLKMSSGSKINGKIIDDEFEEQPTLIVFYDESGSFDESQFSELRKYCSYFESLKVHFINNSQECEILNYECDENLDSELNKIILRVEEGIPNSFIFTFMEMAGLLVPTELTFQESTVEIVTSVLSACFTELTAIKILRFENITPSITFDCLNTLSNFPNLESLSLSCTEISDLLNRDPEDPTDWLDCDHFPIETFPSLKVLGLSNDQQINQNLLLTVFPNAIVIYT